MRILVLLLLLPSIVACGTEPADPPPELSAFYMAVDLEPVKASLESRFARHTRTSARYSTGGKGIGFEGYWNQDVLVEGPLVEGDTVAQLTADVLEQVRVLTTSGGATLDEAIVSREEGTTTHRLPYRHDRNEGEWLVQLGPGAKEGEVVLQVRIRERMAR